MAWLGGICDVAQYLFYDQTAGVGWFGGPLGALLGICSTSAWGVGDHDFT